MTETMENTKPSSGKSRLIRSVLANWGGYLFSIVVTFFLSPFIVHHLGNSLYGIWTLIVSLTGYLGLLDLGVRGAVTRYVAKFHEQENHRDASRTASSALAIFAGLGLLAVTVACIVAFEFLNRLQIPPEFQHAARVVLLISGGTVALALMSGVFGGVVVALHRFDLTNAIEVTAMSVRTIAIIFVLTHGFGIITLAVIQWCSSLAVGLAYLIVSFRQYPQLRISALDMDREHFRLIFSFSLYSFLLNIFAYVILYTDNVVIAIYQPVTLVTFFAIAGNLITYSRGLVSGITTTITPLASRMEAQGDLAGLRPTVLATARTASALILPITLTFILRGKTFIGLWMGHEYADLSGHVLWVLAIFLLFGPAASVGWAVVFGLSKHKALVPPYLLESLSNLALSIFLVKRIGIVGVAWGTTIPNVVITTTFWPWYLRRTVHIPIRSWVAQAWLRPLIAMIPFAACGYAMDRWWHARNLFFFFSQVALALPLAFFGFWYFCLNAEERGNYFALAKNFLSGGVSPA